MSKAVDKLQAAQKRATANRPKVDGFPYLAETLRQAGVRRNIWSLPSCQSIYIMEDGPVVMQGTPLVTGFVDIPNFNKEALIKTIKADGAGNSTFLEFLLGAWNAGVIWYQVDLIERTCTYGGCNDEIYITKYSAVDSDH
jgi:uncharacterized protein YbcV (DUF1398 family)